METGPAAAAGTTHSGAFSLLGSCCARLAATQKNGENAMIHNFCARPNNRKEQSLLTLGKLPAASPRTTTQRGVVARFYLLTVVVKYDNMPSAC
jgi:hypothetical protein